MPSVQIERIRAESRELAALFMEPGSFVHALDQHFEQYANRAKRLRKRKGAALLQEYDLPNPVVRELRQSLVPRLQEQPNAGVALIDTVWQRRTREHRELAIYLLGQLPGSKFRNARARLQRWSAENRDEALLRAMAELGSRQMRTTAPLELLPLCKRLLRSGDVYQRGLGLLILKSLIDEGEMDDLPAIMDLMLPVYRKAKKSLRGYLLETLESLIRRSPGEALYFLQQRLSESRDANTMWLAKQALKAFGPYEAAILRENLGGGGN